MEIIPNVHAITGTAVNCYLIVEEQGLTLIDTGLPNYRKKIANYLDSLGFSLENLKNILITHADGDHIGSLADLKSASGAKVYASKVEALAIQKGESSRELKFSGLARLLFNTVNSFLNIKPVEVDEILFPGQELPVLGGMVVVPTPGHTPDHVSFFAPEYSILFAGDSMRANNDGLVPSRGVNTLDEEMALESVRLQAAMNPRIVCVGHGPVVTEAAKKFLQL